MKIDYDITKCSHCNSDDITTMGSENSIYGLVNVVIDETGKTTVNLNQLMPVVATVCRNCGHIDLIHINPKAIQKQN